MEEAAGQLGASRVGVGSRDQTKAVGAAWAKWTGTDCASSRAELMVQVVLCLGMGVAKKDRIGLAVIYAAQVWRTKADTHDLASLGYVFSRQNGPQAPWNS